jgi:hypothetical protein
MQSAVKLAIQEFNFLFLNHKSGKVDELFLVLDHLNKDKDPVSQQILRANVEALIMGDQSFIFGVPPIIKSINEKINPDSKFVKNLNQKESQDLIVSLHALTK